MSADPCSPAAFEARYQATADPWDFATSPYEQGRYDALLTALGRPRYDRAYEPGCSVGAFTTRLAERCERIEATDVSVTAVGQARARCAHQPNVTVEVGSVAAPPDGPFDLVVFSELGYYFDVEDLDAVISGIVARIGEGGELLACHWLGTSEDHVLHGATVHERLGRVVTAPFGHRCHLARPGFVLDSWRRG